MVIDEEVTTDRYDGLRWLKDMRKNGGDRQRKSDVRRDVCSIFLRVSSVIMA